MKKEESKKSIEEAVKDFPGAAINSADNEKDTEKLVEERTKTLNDNPRNNDL